MRVMVFVCVCHVFGSITLPVRLGVLVACLGMCVFGYVFGFVCCACVGVWICMLCMCGCLRRGGGAPGWCGVWLSILISVTHSRLRILSRLCGRGCVAGRGLAK